MSEPLFVFMNKMGEVVVKDLDDAKVFICTDFDWIHIASLEPRTYIENILNSNAKLVSLLRTK
jgi:Zn-finger protein